MIRIDVEEIKVTTKSGTTRQNKPYTIHEQTVYAHVLERDGTPKRYPTAIAVTIEDKEKPYPPGSYQLAPQSVVVGDYGRLELGRIALVPAQAAAVPRKVA